MARDYRITIQKRGPGEHRHGIICDVVLQFPTGHTQRRACQNTEEARIYAEGLRDGITSIVQLIGTVPTVEDGK